MFVRFKCGYRVITVLVVLAIISTVMVTVLPALFLDTSLTRLQNESVIRIGYAIEAPYAFLTPEGAVTGESPEIAAHVAARLGIRKILWHQTKFESLIDELEAGRIDVIAAGMHITPERASRVSFSKPTFRVEQGLLVPKGNPKGIRSYQQLLSIPGIKIAVLSGSVEEKALLSLGIPAHRLIDVPDTLTGRVAVESGAVDCLALSSPTVRWMALKSKTGLTEMAQPLDNPSTEPAGFGAFAFRKEDGKLLAAWNQVLQSYVGSLEHRDLIARFGFSQAELPFPPHLTEGVPK